MRHERKLIILCISLSLLVIGLPTNTIADMEPSSPRIEWEKKYLGQVYDGMLVENGRSLAVTGTRTEGNSTVCWLKLLDIVTGKEIYELDHDCNHVVMIQDMNQNDRMDFILFSIEEVTHATEVKVYLDRSYTETAEHTWPHWTSCGYYPMIDANNDGTMDLICQVMKEEGNLVINISIELRNGLDLSLLWKYNLYDFTNQTNTLIDHLEVMDADRDGTDDVIIWVEHFVNGTYRDVGVVLSGINGSLLWNTRISLLVRQSYICENLTTDAPELFVLWEDRNDPKWPMDYSQYIEIIDSSGNTLKYKDVTDVMGTMGAQLIDFSGDGCPELFTQRAKGGGYEELNISTIPELEVISNVSVRSPNMVPYLKPVSDLNHDGNWDFLVISQYSVSLHDSRTSESIYNISEDIWGGDYIATPQYLIYYSRSHHTWDERPGFIRLGIFDFPNGTLLWQTDIEERINRCYLEDFDEDGLLELIVTSKNITDPGQGNGSVILYELQYGDLPPSPPPPPPQPPPTLPPDNGNDPPEGPVKTTTSIEGGTCINVGLVIVLICVISIIILNYLKRGDWR